MKDGKKKEIIVLVSLGEVLSSYLPDNEGKIFSKRVLDYCWNYIAEDKIDLEYLYDSIDSPDEIDFAYYECVAEPLENKKIFRYLFDVVAYVTKKISIEENISMPQYLDYIHNDFYQDLLGRISNDYPKLKELDNEIGSVYELKSAKLTKVDFESVFSKYM